jgi:hypothetical protein
LSARSLLHPSLDKHTSLQCLAASVVLALTIQQLAEIGNAVLQLCP